MRTRMVYVALALMGAGLLAACDGVSDVLAPYEGQRPLTLLRVTQSFTPDVQWVGGRVAAVGVNRGERAALDSTLVWMMAAPDNSINSHVTVGQQTAEDLIRQYGGTPADSLDHEGTYTFWIAEREMLDRALDSTQIDTFSFADTTVTMNLLLSGTSRGGVDVTMRIIKNETLLGTDYKIDWSPAVPFRQVAIRQGSALPGFQGLVWHIVQPEGEADAIYPPVTIGQLPEGVDEVIPWPEDGTFSPVTYTVWMTNSAWEGDFGIREDGLAFFLLFSSNFE